MLGEDGPSAQEGAALVAGDGGELVLPFAKAAGDEARPEAGPRVGATDQARGDGRAYNARVDLRRTRELLAEAVVRRVVPGAVLAVARGEDEAIVPAGRARIGGESVTEETFFDLASLTKPMVTATVAMTLASRGALALDARVVALVPAFDTGDARRRAVTVRQLLAHASGLPAWRPLYTLASGRAAIVEAAAREPLEREPGSASVYSDLGFLVLGAALEAAGGAPLEAQWAPLQGAMGLAASYAPLRMNCQVAATERVGGVLLEGVVHDENARAMGGVAPHAGLFGRAADVLAWARALLAVRGGRSALPIAPAVLEAFWSPAGVPGSTWCLGFDRPSAVGSSAGTLLPRSAIGHLGFSGTSVWIDPARALAIVLLTNRVHPTRANEEIRALRPALHDAVMRDLSLAG